MRSNANLHIAVNNLIIYDGRAFGESRAVSKQSAFLASHREDGPERCLFSLKKTIWQLDYL